RPGEREGRRTRAASGERERSTRGDGIRASYVRGRHHAIEGRDDDVGPRIELLHHGPASSDGSTLDEEIHGVEVVRDDRRGGEVLGEDVLEDRRVVLAVDEPVRGGRRRSARGRPGPDALDHGAALARRREE